MRLDSVRLTPNTSIDRKQVPQSPFAGLAPVITVRLQVVVERFAGTPVSEVVIGISLVLGFAWQQAELRDGGGEAGRVYCKVVHWCSNEWTRFDRPRGRSGTSYHTRSGVR